MPTTLVVARIGTARIVTGPKMSNAAVVNMGHGPAPRLFRVRVTGSPDR
jgi:hypothetical protein